MQVAEVMSRSVQIASPNDTLQDAANLMAEIDCGAIPVGENDRLVGMITDRDIVVRAVAEGKPANKTTVAEIMSPGIKYVYEDETTEAAAKNMSRLQLRRLPVLNRQKRLVGIVALADLARKQAVPVAGTALRDISQPTTPVTPTI